MAWLNFALATIIFYSIFDFFVKLSSEKLNPWFNAFFINIVATVILCIFMMYSAMQGEKIFQIKPQGLLFSLLAGIAVAGASIFFTKMFAVGTNLSVGVPLVRVGMVILGSILGVIILREGVNLKYGIGILISIFGLYLVLTAK